MSGSGDDPDEDTAGNQPDGSYYSPFLTSSEPGLFGGQYADMQAQSAANGGLNWTGLAPPIDLSGDGTGLAPSVTVAPYLPQKGDLISASSPGAPPPPVDYDFISRNEGGQVNHLYPLRPTSRFPNAGITVATGVDLGAHTADDLKRWGVSDATIAQLQPYLGLKGQAALHAWNQPDNSRTRRHFIGQADLDAMDRGAFNDTVRQIQKAYDATNPAAPFSNLTPGQQTAIVDLAYQSGTNLAKAAPKFWGAATSGDWNGAINELNHFYGAQATPSSHDIQRRVDEANGIKSGRGTQS